MIGETSDLLIDTAGVADLIINDVEIYDATLSGLSTTMQGKLGRRQGTGDVVLTSTMSDTVYIADNRVDERSLC